MADNLRYIAGGAIIGLLAAGLLSVANFLPAAVAKEEPLQSLLSTKNELLPPPLDTDALAKFEFTVEPSVVTDVVKTRRITKIGFGRIEFVDIVTTPSGTYSSDALASAHVRYPGIHKRVKPGSGDDIAAWSEGKGWMPIMALEADSFVSITPFAGGQLVSGSNGTCVFVGTAAYC